MKKGEVALITAKPEYTYGKLGCPPRIPGNTDLEFEIELVSFELPKDVPFFNQLPINVKNKIEFASLDDRIKAAEQDRIDGNEAFKVQQFRKASRAYNKVMSTLLYDVHFQGFGLF
jgi:FK506-binding protein 6